MAIAAAETVLGSCTTGNSFTLTSWTPGANQLVLLGVFVEDQTIVPSISGNSLNFVQVLHFHQHRLNWQCYVFRAMKAAGITTGQITVTVTGNTKTVIAAATRFTGTDTSGTDGSGAIDTFATATCMSEDSAGDDNDMKCDITTGANNCWGVAFGSHRSRTVTLPYGDTAISINNSAGSGGDVVSLSEWYESSASPATITLGGDNDLNGTVAWFEAVVSIKPAASGQTISNAGAIESLEAFGTANISAGLSIYPTAITSEQAFGTPTASVGTYTISNIGQIASQEAFGTPSLVPTLAAESIITQETFGNPVLAAGGYVITDAGNIISSEAFGTPTIAGPITAIGIASSEAFGAASFGGTVVPSFQPHTLISYQIWIDTPTGKRIASVENVISLELVKTANESSLQKISIPATFDTSILQQDAVIEVLRAPAQGALQWEQVFFLREWIVTEADDGTDEVTLIGPCAISLLEHRVIAYASGTSQAKKSNMPADNMLKAIARENLGSLATDVSRRLENFTVEPNESLAPNLSMSFEWKNVLETMQAIANASNQLGTPLYFDVRPYLMGEDEVGLEFYTNIDQPGADHGSDTSDPVVFGRSYDNLITPELDCDYTDETNYVYVIGTGDSQTRALVERSDAARIAKSPWNRRESVVDARQTDTTDELNAIGDAELQDGRPVIRFMAGLKDTNQFKYGMHWRWGDTIAIEYRGKVFDGVILGRHLTVEGGDPENLEVKIEVEITDAWP